MVVVVVAVTAAAAAVGNADVDEDVVVIVVVVLVVVAVVRLTRRLEASWGKDGDGQDAILGLWQHLTMQHGVTTQPVGAINDNPREEVKHSGVSAVKTTWIGE